MTISQVISEIIQDDLIRKGEFFTIRRKLFQFQSSIADRDLLMFTLGRLYAISVILDNSQIYYDIPAAYLLGSELHEIGKSLKEFNNRKDKVYDRKSDRG